MDYKELAKTITNNYIPELVGNTDALNMNVLTKSCIPHLKQLCNRFKKLIEDNLDLAKEYIDLNGEYEKEDTYEMSDFQDEINFDEKDLYCIYPFFDRMIQDTFEGGYLNTKVQSLNVKYRRMIFQYVYERI